MADNIDKGGLRYSITVADDFSTVTRAFREQMSESAAAWETFRASAQSASTIGAGMREFVRASQEAATATATAADASREAATTTTLHQKAVDKLTTSVEKALVAAEAERIANEQGIQVGKQAVTATSIRQQAVEKLATSVQKALVAAEAERIALEQGIKLGKEKAAALTAEEKAVARLAEAQKNAGNSRLQQLSAEEIAIKRIVAADRERAAAAILAAQGRTASGGFQGPNVSLVSPPPDITLADKAFQKFTTDLENARVNALTDRLKEVHPDFAQFRQDAEESSVSLGNLTTIVRNLVVGFVAFKAFSFVVQAFKAIADAAFTYNVEIERSQLAIAALIQSTGEVSDATGRSVNASRSFALAQTEARRQTELLRQDALAATVSFEALVKTFQIALGPGLQAGLDLGQIRKLSVQISQAALALGVAQNQLSDDIRGIIAGAITARTNRVAAALGITNDDIKRAREAGVLSDFLEKKFAAFNAAGVAAADTLSGALSRVNDAFVQILGLGTNDFFNALKNNLKDIVNLLTTRGQDGVIRPNPDAVQFVKGLTSDVTDLLNTTHKVQKELDLTGSIGAGHLAMKALRATFALTAFDIEKLKAVTNAFAEALHAGRVAAERLGDGIGTAANAFIDKIGKSSPAAAAILKSALQSATSETVVLSKTFSDMPGIVRGSTDELLRANEVVKQLESDTRKSNETLAVGLGTLGLSGAVLEERKQLAQAAFKAQEDSRAITERQKTTEEDLLGVRRKIIDTASRLLDLDGAQIGLVNKILAAGEDQIAAENKLAVAKSDAATAEVTLQQARAAGVASEIRAAQAADTVAKSKVANAEKELDAQRHVSDEVLKNTGFSAAKLKESVQFGTSLLSLRGQEQATIETINQLADARLEIEERTAQAIRNRVTETALAETQTVKKSNETLAIQLENEKRLFTARLTKSPLQLQIAEGQGQIDVAKEQLDLTTKQAQRDDASLAALKAKVTEEEKITVQKLAQDQSEAGRNANLDILVSQDRERIALSDQLLESQKKHTAEQEIQKTKIKEAQIEQDRLRLIAEQPVKAGIVDALKDFTDNAVNTFNVVTHTLTEVISSFANLVSGLIVDAFDPTKKVDIKQRFVEFLQGISKIIIAELTKIAIAQAILRGASLVGGLAEGGPVVGRAAGGLIPSSGLASLAHYSAGVRGHAQGRMIRPAGLDPRDTVPIWAQPGEWMMRLSAVRAYGADAMAAINAGFVNPGALRAVALGGRGSASIRTPSAPSFATGGLVADRFAAAERESKHVVLPAIAANDRTMSELLNGGSGAFFAFLEANPSRARAAIGLHGGQHA